MKWMGRVWTLLFASVLLTVAAHAQYAPLTLKASVPFEFNVENKAFPAGDYLIQRSGPHGLTLRTAAGKFLMVIQTNPVQSLDPRETAIIRFRTVGGHHVLEQVWQDGVSTGYQLHVPRQPGNLVATQGPLKEQQAQGRGLAGNEGTAGHE